MRKDSASALAVAVMQVSQLPYAGTWKLNVAKSDFAETTVTFGQDQSGQIRFISHGQTYTFQMDGIDYPSLPGRTAAWKEIDNDTWETVHKQNDKVIFTDATTLSPDGDILTITTRGLKPSGGTFEQSMVLERVSGTVGLLGKWKTTNVTTSAPTNVELIPSGIDGLIIKIRDFQMTSEVKFDGSDYPVTGGAVPPGLTFALRKTGPRSFDLLEKQHGKPIFKLSFEVSSDGMTMTERGGAIGVNEPFTAVYERQ
jgi:hypothetical protein